MLIPLRSLPGRCCEGSLSSRMHLVDWSKAVWSLLSCWRLVCTPDGHLAFTMHLSATSLRTLALFFCFMSATWRHWNVTSPAHPYHGLPSSYVEFLQRNFLMQQENGEEIRCYCQSLIEIMAMKNCPSDAFLWSSQHLSYDITRTNHDRIRSFSTS